LLRHERGSNVEILKLVEENSSLCDWKYTGYSRKGKTDLLRENIGQGVINSCQIIYG